MELFRFKNANSYASFSSAVRPRVSGCSRFADQVHSSLYLLEARNNDIYLFVCGHLGLIQEHERSGVVVHGNPPVFQLSRRSAFYSVTWCAGAIVHDSFHVWQYANCRARHGNPVPSSVYSSVRAEREAIAYQLAAMRSLGAPAHELQSLQKADGSYVKIPYWQRSW